MTDQTRPDLSEQLHTLDANVVGLRREVVAERTIREAEVSEARAAGNAAKAAAEKAQTAIERSTLASTRSRRVMWLVIGMAALGAAVNTGLIVRENVLAAERRADQTRAAVVTCQNGNRTRAELIVSIDARFGHYTESLAKVTNVDRTPEEIARVTERVSAIAAELSSVPWPAILAEPRDCSPEALTSPTTIGR